MRNEINTFDAIWQRWRETEMEKDDCQDIRDAIDGIREELADCGRTTVDEVVVLASVIREIESERSFKEGFRMGFKFNDEMR